MIQDNSKVDARNPFHFFSQLGIKKESLKSLQINSNFKFSQHKEAERKVNLTL